MDYSESQKVICAAFMLKMGASHLCDIIKRAYHMEESPIEWIEFKELFLNNYFFVGKMGWEGSQIFDTSVRKYDFGRVWAQIWWVNSLCLLG